VTSPCPGGSPKRPARDATPAGALALARRLHARARATTSDPAARLSRQPRPHHRQQLHPSRGALEHASARCSSSPPPPSRPPRHPPPPPTTPPPPPRHTTPTATKPPQPATTPQKNGGSRLRAGFFDFRPSQS